MERTRKKRKKEEASESPRNDNIYLSENRIDTGYHSVSEFRDILI